MPGWLFRLLVSGIMVAIFPFVPAGSKGVWCSSSGGLLFLPKCPASRVRVEHFHGILFRSKSIAGEGSQISTKVSQYFSNEFEG